MDSVGIGEAPDAKNFGDEGSHTLGHIAEKMGGLHMPHMERLGLSNINEIKGIAKVAQPEAYYTKLQEASVGKDTMTGHWEIMGLHIQKPFQVFPNGFPEELIQELEEKTGRKVIGNKPASGTVILDELGKSIWRQVLLLFIRRLIRCYKSPPMRKSYQLKNSIVFVKLLEN